MYVPYLTDLWRLFFPRRCALCSRPLADAEQLLCLDCLAGLPRVGHYAHDNPAEHRVFGRMAYEHGGAYLFYDAENATSRLIQKAKYGHQPWVNAQLAHICAAELAQSGWPYDADVIVPVPTHWVRRLRRGYNQAQAAAEALGRAWNLPVETDCLVKTHYTRSQVGRSFEKRRASVAGSFGVRHPERLHGRHVLLVDDVLTTGATLTACVQALKGIHGLRLSFLTLSMTK